MNQVYHLSYAISKQLTSFSALSTDYGELELDEEMQQAVKAALTPILERKIKESSDGSDNNPTILMEEKS